MVGTTRAATGQCSVRHTHRIAHLCYVLTSIPHFGVPVSLWPPESGAPWSSFLIFLAPHSCRIAPSCTVAHSLANNISIPVAATPLWLTCSWTQFHVYSHFLARTLSTIYTICLLFLLVKCCETLSSCHNDHETIADAIPCLLPVAFILDLHSDSFEWLLV